MIKNYRGNYRFRDSMKKKAMKRHYDSLTEVVVELDGKIIFRGHRDSRELKWILRDNPTAIVIKGELRCE